jgi:hypothetical protein
MSQARGTERESSLQRALRFFGLRRDGPRKPPSKATLWLLASLSMLGVLLMAVSDLHGFVNALGVGLFGGCGGGWLRGMWDRDHAKRASQPTSH